MEAWKWANNNTAIGDLEQIYKELITNGPFQNKSLLATMKELKAEYTEESLTVHLQDFAGMDENVGRLEKEVKTIMNMAKIRE